jgi:ubiquinol-cytochrome c reductase cytochrome c subunit
MRNRHGVPLAAAVVAVAVVLVAPGLASTGGNGTASGGDVAAGRALYVESCSSCHGMDARGREGVAPSLAGVGALAADFALSTGRMPMADPSTQPVRADPAFDARQRRDLVAYIASLGGPGLPSPDVAHASIADGRRLFAESCAGCHTSLGAGGVITGASVPALQRATPRQIVEAIRLGPYLMPRFGDGELSDAQVAAVARYVVSTRAPVVRGGWGIGHIGPVPEGLVAWLIGLTAMLGIARLLGERAR